MKHSWWIRMCSTLPFNLNNNGLLCRSFPFLSPSFAVKSLSDICELDTSIAVTKTFFTLPVTRLPPLRVFSLPDKVPIFRFLLWGIPACFSRVWTHYYYRFQMPPAFSSLKKLIYSQETFVESLRLPPNSLYSFRTFPFIFPQPRPERIQVRATFMMIVATLHIGWMEARLTTVQHDP